MSAKVTGALVGRYAEQVDRVRKSKKFKLLKQVPGYWRLERQFRRSAPPSEIVDNANVASRNRSGQRDFGRVRDQDRRPRQCNCGSRSVPISEAGDAMAEPTTNDSKNPIEHRNSTRLGRGIERHE